MAAAEIAAAETAASPSARNDSFLGEEERWRCGVTRNDTWQRFPTFRKTSYSRIISLSLFMLCDRISIVKKSSILDEVALIRAARDGDLNSFNRLVLEYQDLVYNQAFRILGDPHSADDATQEAFVSAYTNIRSYRGGSFRAWLLRIVTNACYDELRRRKRRPTTPLEPLDDAGEEIESPGWMVDPGESPEEASQRAELAGAIQDCISALPAEFRAVVALVDVQGLDYAEASEAIGSPLGTVKSRLARARARLRECLQGFWELLPGAFRLESEA